MCGCGWASSEHPVCRSVQEPIRTKRVMPLLKPAVLSSGVWRYVWPARVRHVLARSAAYTLLFVVAFGVPAAAVFAVVLHGNRDSMPGDTYCIVKAAWVGVLSPVVFTAMFIPAVSADNFDSPADEAMTDLLDTGSARDHSSVGDGDVERGQ